MLWLSTGCPLSSTPLHRPASDMSVVCAYVCLHVCAYYCLSRASAWSIYMSYFISIMYTSVCASTYMPVCVALCLRLFDCIINGVFVVRIFFHRILTILPIMVLMTHGFSCRPNPINRSFLPPILSSKSSIHSSSAHSSSHPSSSSSSRFSSTRFYSYSSFHSFSWYFSHSYSCNTVNYIYHFSWEVPPTLFYSFLHIPPPIPIPLPTSPLTVYSLALPFQTLPLVPAFSLHHILSLPTLLPTDRLLFHRSPITTVYIPPLHNLSPTFLLLCLQILHQNHHSQFLN